MTQIAARPTQGADDAFVGLARELAERFRPRSAAHDATNSFVHENFDDLLEAGYLKLAVPTELGGLGASMRQVCFAQAELARGCGATALAVNMHLYLTLVQGFRRRSGAADAEAVLRRVADEGLVLMTSGGSDWLWSNGTAVPDGDGYRVNGRKVFCSQAPVADVLTTSAVHELPDGGREVLMFSVPMSSEGVRVVETWDTLGMRATASHDVELTDVLVPEARISARRQWGRFDAPLKVALVHFSPLVAAVYWGVAKAARDEAVETVGRMRRGPEPRAELPSVQRQVGLMDALLRRSWWSITGSLDELGDDYAADGPTVAMLALAKRQAVLDAVAVVDCALEVVGGPSYFRTSPLERAYRDVRAGPYHPFTPEATLAYAGRLALGGPDDIE